MRSSPLSFALHGWPQASAPAPRTLVSDRGALTRTAVIAALLLLALFALPPLMSAYYTDTMTQAAIYSIVTLGLGLLVNRVGLYSLGQLAVLTIGGWVGARLLFATSQPYILVVIEAGLATMIIGSLITLPALRLRGLYLALITLMLAGGVAVIEATLNFPNGGGGFSGYNGSLTPIPQIRRPSFAGTDPAFYRFSVITAIVMFLLVFAHLRLRPGRAWAAIRQSEPSALAAGINTTFYKVWAMALAAFVTGVAGALLAGADHELFSIDFPILDGMNLRFDRGVCGLIGPNGAGKTTFFNVLSGFVRPASGTVAAFGDDLLRMPHFRRARWGVRRAFQTEQAISALTVYDNVAMIHSRLRGSARRADILAAVEFVGGGVSPGAKVGSLTAGQRRLVEVARTVAGKPRLVLLDEPAAGLPDGETSHLTGVIKAIPEHTGALTILVDHDMSLVSAVCETTAVLDFGKLIPSGATAQVLRDEHVMRAYALGKQAAAEGRARALELFPRLRERLTVPARLLSGGEQQMVVLAQALVSQPKYILIDELSLGLAPVIVNQLIPVIRAIAAGGVGVLLIEQFATVALSLATGAHVMEGGVLRYSGTGAESKARPELLHSAYLLRGAAVAPAEMIQAAGLDAPAGEES